MAPRMRRRITSAKREQIEKEQEALSKSIVRPFDVVNGLPVSYNMPPYGHYEDVLKTPLTVKDSGILYRSLMKSRTNYITVCPMFRLYWVKQTSYVKKLIGENKLSKVDTDRPPVLGADVNARDVMVKLCDSGMTLGPHSFEIRIFIAKDDRSTKKDDDDDEKVTDLTNEQNNDKPENSDTGKPEPESTIEVKKEEMEKTESPAEQSAPSVEAPKIANDKVEDKSAVEEPAKPQVYPPPTPEKSTATVTSETPAISTPQNVPFGQARTDGIAITNQSQPLTTPKPLMGIPLSQLTAANPQAPPQSASNTTSTTAPKPKKRAANDLESDENKLMIANLNAVAKVDPDLRALMEIIAGGDNEPKHLIRFNAFIARAKEMGPPPHSFLIPNFRMDPFQPFRSRKPPKEKKITKAALKDLKLTAFQEKYISEATLVFEFVENPNVRYMLPKHAICEVLPSKMGSEERDILISFLWIHNQNELDIYEKELEEYNNAIKEKERKEQEEENKIKAEEERQRLISEGKLVEEPAPEAQAAPASSRTRRRPPPKKTKKQAPKKLVAPEEPELRFTPVSYTIHDISVKFVPIITNSFKPEKEVQEFMKQVLEKGTRTSALNLWYQVDGKLDEELAENVRNELINEEKKLLGFSSVAANASKKRKM